MFRNENSEKAGWSRSEMRLSALCCPEVKAIDEMQERSDFRWKRKAMSREKRIGKGGEGLALLTRLTSSSVPGGRAPSWCWQGSWSERQTLSEREYQRNGRGGE